MRRTWRVTWRVAVVLWCLVRIGLSVVVGVVGIAMLLISIVVMVLSVARVFLPRT